VDEATIAVGFFGPSVYVVTCDGVKPLIANCAAACGRSLIQHHHGQSRACGVDRRVAADQARARVVRRRHRRGGKAVMLSVVVGVEFQAQVVRVPRNGRVQREAR